MGRVWIAIAFFVAVAVAAVAGSVVNTYLNLMAIAEMAGPISSQDQIDTIIHDVRSMGPTYAAIITLGFLVAFSAAGYVATLAPSLRWFVFLVAGGAALATALGLMSMLLGVTPVAAARTPQGLALLAIAGALGGLVFSILKRPMRYDT